MERLDGFLRTVMASILVFFAFASGVHLSSRRELRQVGEIEFADVLKYSNGNHVGGELVSCVDYRSSERAIKGLTDTNLKGRPIFVRKEGEGGSTVEYKNDRGGRFLLKDREYGGSSGMFVDGRESGSISVGSNTVHVGDLDWSVKWKDLKDYMKQASSIEYADVLTYNDCKSTGEGLVRYINVQDAQATRATTLKGRLLFFRKYREFRGRRGERLFGGQGRGGNGDGVGLRSEISAFVGNLSWWQTLKDLFQKYLHLNAGVSTFEQIPRRSSNSECILSGSRLLQICRLLGGKSKRKRKKPSGGCEVTLSAENANQILAAHEKTAKLARLEDMDQLVTEQQQLSKEIQQQQFDERKTKAAQKQKRAEWVDDGLGGKYNGEGFTGRKTVGDKLRIFKIDQLKAQNKPISGKTKACPFDCNCCFI